MSARGCTQTCPLYNHACIEVGRHCFTWDQVYTTTDPCHPPARASLRTLHSREWVRARSSMNSPGQSSGEPIQRKRHPRSQTRCHQRARLELKREEMTGEMSQSTFGTWICCSKRRKTQFSQGVRVGPSVRMPRLPALYRPKRKWRAAQSDPSNYQEEEAACLESSWRSNDPSVSEHTERAVKVLEDQTSRGQLIKLPKAEARARYPNLVIASLPIERANRAEKYQHVSFWMAPTACK